MNNRQATLEDLALQAQFLMDLQGVNRKAADKVEKWTDVITRNSKEPNGSGKPCRVMTIRDTSAQSKSAEEACSKTNSGAKVVETMALAPSSNGDETDYSLVDSGTIIEFATATTKRQPDPVISKKTTIS